MVATTSAANIYSFTALCYLMNVWLHTGSVDKQLTYITMVAIPELQIKTCKVTLKTTSHQRKMDTA